MNFKVTSLVLCAGVSLLALLPGKANAQALTTFASVDTIGQVFQFLNSGAGSTFGLTSASIPVTFRYKIANGYGGIDQNIDATMTLTSLVSGGPGGFDQGIGDIQLSITANTPINGQTNLLSMGATGRLTSQAGSDIANFGGNTRNNFIVGFSSDFLDFTNTTDRAFNFALNSLNPPAGLNGNGYMNTWNATGLGNFATIPAAQTTVPEPATLALLGLAAIPGVVALRRRRS
ncbi:MAG: PEP-CTERM sorting domain-containing protein [Armatimonas sp.]